jgi:hypothetical protein
VSAKMDSMEFLHFVIWRNIAVSITLVKLKFSVWEKSFLGSL